MSNNDDMRNVDIIIMIKYINEDEDGVANLYY